MRRRAAIGEYKLESLQKKITFYSAFIHMYLYKVTSSETSPNNQNVLGLQSKQKNNTDKFAADDIP